MRSSAPSGRLGSSKSRSLSFNARFVDEHHGNIAADGINAAARFPHFNPVLVTRDFNPAFLHSGQTKISNSSFETAILFLRTFVALSFSPRYAGSRGTSSVFRIRRNHTRGNPRLFAI